MVGSQETTVRWLNVSALVRDGQLSSTTDLSDWSRICALGSVELLQRSALGLFCSIRCPGKVIVEVYDLARALRDAGVPVISGFHTPMEKECLELLLRGTQPIIVCPARSIERIRLPAPMKAGVEAERLLFLSPFEAKERRPTAGRADERNRLVAALAKELFVAHAAPGGKIEELCQCVMAAGKRVLTVNCVENANLIDLGAQPSSIAEVVERWHGARR